MKRCAKCNIDYDTEKFCKKCGAQLIDVQDANDLDQEVFSASDYTVSLIAKPQAGNIVQPTVEPENLSVIPKPEELVEENKQNKKEKKEKKIEKTSKKIIKIIVLLLVIVIAFSAGTIWYFTSSQLTMPSKGSFDKEEYQNELLPDLFGSTDFSIVIPKEAINEYLNDEITVNSSQYQILGSEISDLVLASNNQEVFIQFANGILKSTAVMAIDISNNDNKLILENKGIKIGQFKMPIFGNFVSNLEGVTKIMLGSYEFPKSVQIDKVKLVNAGLQVKGEFDVKYLHDVMIKVFEQRKAEFQAIESMTEDQLKILDLMDRVNELSDKDILDFFFSYFYNDEFASSLLASIKTDQVESATEMLSLDLFKLSDDQMSARSDKSLKISERYEENAEVELLEQKKEEAIKYSGEVLEALNKYHEDQGKTMHLISYNGIPYSTTTQQLITTSSFTMPSNSEFSSTSKIFIKDGIPYVCLPFASKYIVSDGKSSDMYDDFNLAKTAYGYTESITTPTNSLLPKGNNDRTNIAEVASSFINSNNSVFIKYLKSDNTWAFLMCTPGNNSQEIINVILKKSGSTWQVVATFDKNFTSRSIDSTLIAQGFNVTLLPPYEYGDFLNFEADSSYINAFKEYLYDQGDVIASDECDYFAKVETAAVMVFSSGKKFILEMNATNMDDVVNVITIQKGQHFIDYSYILEKHFGSYIPTYIFLQN